MIPAPMAGIGHQTFGLKNKTFADNPGLILSNG
jgi:hypothetical protein